MATIQNILGKSRVQVSNIQTIFGKSRILLIVPPLDAVRKFYVEPLVIPFRSLVDNRVFWVAPPHSLF